ncbi:MAG TPA: hypothetical protein ENJ68_01585 [Devosia sp.]|nr:hypothetical protein [Devosia sp.]
MPPCAPEKSAAGKVHDMDDHQTRFPDKLPRLFPGTSRPKRMTRTAQVLLLLIVGGLASIPGVVAFSATPPSATPATTSPPERVPGLQYVDRNTLDELFRQLAGAPDKSTAKILSSAIWRIRFPADNANLARLMRTATA